MQKFTYIPRLLSKQLIGLTKNFPTVVLVGARQVGKSTLIKHLFPHYGYFQFDPYEDIEGARQDPDLFLKNRPPPLILDEVQYAPEIISAIKRRIDSNREPGQYILTGSQQWGVMKQMAETLTGRTVIIQLEPFSLDEIADNKPSESWLEQWILNKFKPPISNFTYLKLKKTPFEQIWRGFLPEAQKIEIEYVQAFHSAYQKTYIERDVRLLADIHDLHLFTRFVRLTAALTAREINYQQIGRELGIANQTAHRWLSLLKEIFEWHEIPAFSLNTIKRLSARPKGYFSDTGQICYCQAMTAPLVLGSSPLWGSVFETAVINEIRKQLLWIGKPFNLYHWRTHGGAECDLLIERDNVFYPIECKATTNPTRGDTSGITAFRKTFPNLNIAPGLVICLADKAYQLSENDYALPWNIRSF